MDKKAIRTRIKACIQQLSPDRRKEKSHRIWEQLQVLEEFQKAHVVMYYVSTSEEVDTHFMIDKTIQLGKQVVVPRISSEKDTQLIISVLFDRHADLERGPWGILQPKADAARSFPAADIDLIIVPGLAFDPQGHRLGRGKGYYDQFLSKKGCHIPTIGLAFDCQIVDSLPVCPHDVSVHKLLVA